MTDPYHYDWADLAFGSKKPLRELKAVFIAAPRELSGKRLRQLIKTYLPKGNIVWGVAKEPYVAGFEGQPQFRTLQPDAVRRTAAHVNALSTDRHLYILEYFQRELVHVVEKLAFSRAVFINGSWQHVFHSSPAYYYLSANRIPYDMVSPFTDEAEAKAYEQATDQEIARQLDTRFGRQQADYTEVEMLHMAALAATRSYDYSFQTGVALGKETPGKPGRYQPLACTFNKVVPYQTYALHYGASREKHFSPPHDLNHYDTVHAEVELLIAAQRQKISLQGTTMFINLLPCPSCARMLVETDIEEFVYHVDHSDGYAVKMLEMAGKKVRRVMV